MYDNNMHGERIKVVIFGILEGILLQYCGIIKPKYTIKTFSNL